VTTSTDRQWSASSVDDLGLTGRLFHLVTEEVLALAVEREDVARTLLEVKNLLAPPSTLLRPGILLPALRRTALSLLTEPKKPRSGEPKAEVPMPSDLVISGERSVGWLIGLLCLLAFLVGG
jgi:hypothetical protein